MVKEVLIALLAELEQLLISQLLGVHLDELVGFDDAFEHSVPQR